MYIVNLTNNMDVQKDKCKEGFTFHLHNIIYMSVGTPFNILLQSTQSPQKHK